MYQLSAKWNIWERNVSIYVIMQKYWDCLNNAFLIVKSLIRYAHGYQVADVFYIDWKVVIYWQKETLLLNKFLTYS